MRSIKNGIVHGLAYCGNCGWDSGIKINERNRMQALRNRIAKHVRDTNHEVRLETGNSTIYLPS